MKFPAAALLGALLFTSACLVDDEDLEIGSDSSEVTTYNRMAYNRMAYNRMAYNRMAYNSLATNAISSVAIVDEPLSSETYTGSSWPSPYLRQQLLDPGAQEFMTYLVSCALPAGHDVEWLSPDRTRSKVFAGELGLCPDWEYGAPNDTCQEVVSGCLLARNNAFGTKVALSLRGLDADGNPILHPNDRPRPAFERTIDSYDFCRHGEAGTSRDCGWIRDYIGTCTPGNWFYVGQSTCYGDASLRICEGRSGCDDDQSLATVDHLCSAGRWLRCPSSGTFSVMKAPYRSGDWAYAKVKTWYATYPATELQIFNVREGAFFGNIFGGRFNRDISVTTSSRGVTSYRYKSKVTTDMATFADTVRDTIFTDMYSCFSDEWNEAEAYFRRRICAGEDNEGCAATVVGGCRGYHSFTSPLFKCTTNDNSVQPGDEDYDNCRDDKRVMWRNPITVHLDNLCDVYGKDSCPF